MVEDLEFYTKDCIYSFVNMFLIFVVVFFLFVWIYPHTREYFTHMETSPLPVKGYKVLPRLGTHGHLAERVH